MQDIASVMRGVLDPLFRKKPHMSLMMDWMGIMGEELGKSTWPQKIIHRTATQWIVYVGVRQGMEFFVWAMTGQMTTRLNSYLGCQGTVTIRLLRQISKDSGPNPENFCLSIGGQNAQ